MKKVLVTSYLALAFSGCGAFPGWGTYELTYCPVHVEAVITGDAGDIAYICSRLTGIPHAAGCYIDGLVYSPYSDQYSGVLRHEVLGHGGGIVTVNPDGFDDRLDGEPQDCLHSRPLTLEEAIGLMREKHARRAD